MSWRFAPSPTGALHLGSLRIALLNFIQSQKSKGRLILRIEDTDQKRLIKGSDQRFISVLDWVGIKFTEKYVQSERLSIYRDKINQLLQSKQAYKCFCSVQELESMRLDAAGKKVSMRYDQRCRHLSQEQVDQNLQKGLPYVVRFKVPLISNVQFNDLIHGNIKFENSSLDDLILLKSDGWPTYHLANVVDDHEMKISQVIRGQEWISSTPKHILLYKAFGWDVPCFAHLPLLLNKDGSKLSKRQADLSIESLKVFIGPSNFENQGYFPEAITSFVLSLGWSNDKNEGLSLLEACQEFDISKVSKSSCIVSLEKLESLNKMWLQRKMEDPSQLNLLIESIKSEIQKSDWEISNDLKWLENEEHFKSLVLACKDRVRKLPDFKHFLKPFFVSHQTLSSTSLNQLEILKVDYQAIVQDCINYVTNLSGCIERSEVKTILHDIASSRKLKVGIVAKIIRIVLTDETVRILNLKKGWSRFKFPDYTLGQKYYSKKIEILYMSKFSKN